VEQFFFYNWTALLRTAVIGVSAYVCLIVLLRLTGKRTLSKMNAFDLVVTVALGSTLATVLLDQDVALAQGVLAFAVLVGLQFIITWTSVRVPWVRKLVTGEPTLLLYRGQYLPRALRDVRITEEEVRAAVRSAGLSSLAEAEAVVLETDGSVSVVRHDSRHEATSLRDFDLPAREGRGTIPATKKESNGALRE
jgi:uncharacterized membrane protein YcaP (DUF421 family)